MMKLPEDECKLFYNLYHPLLLFINQQQQILADVFTLEGLRKKSSEQLKTLRNILLQQPDMLDHFIVKNPINFSSGELDIIESWKKWIIGRF